MGHAQSTDVKNKSYNVKLDTEAAERETNEALKLAAVAVAVAVGVIVGAMAVAVASVVHVFGASCNERKTMKAPGRDCCIFRDELEKRLPDCFRNTRN